MDVYRFMVIGAKHEGKPKEDKYCRHGIVVLVLQIWMINLSLAAFLVDLFAQYAQHYASILCHYGTNTHFLVSVSTDFSNFASKLI